LARKQCSAVEMKIIDLEMEKSKLNREKSLLVINKSLFLYFIFLFTGVIGFINGYVNTRTLNILIFMGLIVLVIGIVPYITTMRKEEKNLNSMIADLKSRVNR
jgi:uncharacterized membrane protein (DUF485 family)